MPKCPFATFHAISGSSGPYAGGPFKIVHHTTEGSTAQAAMDAFRTHKSDPHFTVDGSHIVQHIDTNEAARALRHPPGTPETNRDSAVQIEVVGFAGRPKSPATLTLVARLCRWIETVHGVPRVWPAGPPKPPVHGADPGGHRRDPAIWDSKGGHYGHSHVPNNTHWDPAYTAVEAAFILKAEFDGQGQLSNRPDPAVAALLTRVLPMAMAAAEDSFEVIADHADVGETP
jgi:hypothetical protein